MHNGVRRQPENDIDIHFHCFAAEEIHQFRGKQGMVARCQQNGKTIQLFKGGQCTGAGAGFRGCPLKRTSIKNFLKFLVISIYFFCWTAQQATFNRCTGFKRINYPGQRRFACHIDQHAGCQPQFLTDRTAARPFTCQHNGCEFLNF